MDESPSTSTRRSAAGFGVRAPRAPVPLKPASPRRPGPRQHGADPQRNAGRICRRRVLQATSCPEETPMVRTPSYRVVTATLGPHGRGQGTEGGARLLPEGPEGNQSTGPSAPSLSDSTGGRQSRPAAARGPSRGGAVGGSGGFGDDGRTNLLTVMPCPCTPRPAVCERDVSSPPQPRSPCPSRPSCEPGDGSPLGSVPSLGSAGTVPQPPDPTRSPCSAATCLAPSLITPAPLARVLPQCWPPAANE